MTLRILLLVSAIAACGGPRKPPEVSGVAGAALIDRSTHRARLVRTEPGVVLEVLDWGGRGPPVVFLAGLTCTAHIFDNFAPKLTEHFHVYGITRRGFGASSQPTSGYDVPRLAADILAVLDTLELSQVSLIGHSLGGQEMTQLEAMAPQRLARLVYLDAAYDLPEYARLRIQWPDDPPMTPVDSASPQAVSNFVAQSWGVRLPDGEVLQTYVFDSLGHLVRQHSPDSIAASVFRQAGPFAYRKIRAPTLAVFAVLTSPSDMNPRYATADSAYRAAADRYFALYVPYLAAQRARFAREVAGARAVELPGARHELFLSNEADVLREVRSFLARE